MELIQGFPKWFERGRDAGNAIFKWRYCVLVCVGDKKKEKLKHQNLFDIRTHVVFSELNWPPRILFIAITRVLPLTQKLPIGAHSKYSKDKIIFFLLPEKNLCSCICLFTYLQPLFLLLLLSSIKMMNGISYIKLTKFRRIKFPGNTLKESYFTGSKRRVTPK